MPLNGFMGSSRYECGGKSFTSVIDHGSLPMPHRKATEKRCRPIDGRETIHHAESIPWLPTIETSPRAQAFGACRQEWKVCPIFQRRPLAKLARVPEGGAF